jgi:hypothetical protein
MPPNSERRKELLERKRQILQQMISLEDSTAATEPKEKAQPVEEGPRKGSFLSMMDAVLNPPAGGRILPLPGFPPQIPEESLPESVRPFTMGTPTAGQVGRGLWKLPGEIYEAGKGLVGGATALATDPEARQEALDVAGTLGKGAFDIVKQNIPPASFPRKTTPEAEAVKGLGLGMMQSITETAQEPGLSFERRPLETLATASLVASPLSPAGLYFDPFSAAAKASGALARFGGRKFAKGMTQRSAKAAGTGERTLEIAREIGVEEGFGKGGARTKIFKEAQEGIRTPITAAMKVEEAAGEARKFRNARYKKQMKKLQADNPDVKVDLRRVQENILESLEAEGLHIEMVDDVLRIVPKPNSVFIGVADELTPLADLVTMVAGWTDNSITGTHTLREAIDKLREKAGDFSTRADLDRIMEGARGKVREGLHKVPGFDKMDQDWSEAMTFLALMEQTLGVGKRRRGSGVARIDEVDIPDIPEGVYTKIGNLLNDRTSQNLELRKTLIQELDKILEKQTGVKSSIEAELAGIRLSKEAPQGLAGATRQGGQRTWLASLLGGSIGQQAGGIEGMLLGGAVGFGGDYVINLIRKMTVENPRSVGTVFRGLGATEKVANDIAAFFSRLRRNLPAQMVEKGVTAGVAIDLMMERRGNSFLGRVGRASPSRAGGSFGSAARQLVK